MNRARQTLTTILRNSLIHPPEYVCWDEVDTCFFYIAQYPDTYHAYSLFSIQSCDSSITLIPPYYGEDYNSWRDI